MHDSVSLTGNGAAGVRRPLLNLKLTTEPCKYTPYTHTCASHREGSNLGDVRTWPHTIKPLLGV
jgi:hypothetical protein